MKSMLKSYWSAYTPKGQFWLTIAVIMLGVDAAISYQYGVTQTTLHGVGFAMLAVLFALLPDQAYEEYAHGRKASGIVLALACIPLGAVAYYSHIGYGAGVRVGDVQRTTVQNVRYDDARDAVDDARRTVAMFENRLRDLEAKQGWAASASADGLRARLPALELAIKQEASRGGCKSLCLQRTKERDDIMERIKTLEARDDYTSRIAAAKLVIERARAKAADTKHVQSSVVNQTNVAAQLWLAVNGVDPAKAINPDQVTFSFVNILIAGAGALAFMLMAPIGFFVAGRNRRELIAQPMESAPAQSYSRTEYAKPKIVSLQVNEPVFKTA